MKGNKRSMSMKKPVIKESRSGYMLKYVIFDFDGTIADSKMALLSSWNSLAKKYNFKEMKFDEIETLKKLSMKERCKLLNFPIYKLPIIIPQMYKLYRKAINDVTLFDGVKDLLHQLEKKGYKTTIISSNSKENIEGFLKRHKIESVTNVLCSSNIFGKDKLIKKFLKEHKLKASEVMYVGDEHRDIVACKKTGVKMIWVGWGYDSIEVIEAEKPDYKVYKPAEILEVI
jgi:phosphoglycolate phosphatase